MWMLLLGLGRLTLGRRAGEGNDRERWRRNSVLVFDFAHRFQPNHAAGSMLEGRPGGSSMVGEHVPQVIVVRSHPNAH